MILPSGVLTLALALLAAQGPKAARAAAKHKGVRAAAPAKIQPRAVPAPSPPPRVAPVPRRNDTSATSSAATATSPDDARSTGGGATASDAMGEGAGPAKSAKTKVYTFGAMDVEGKLKTPQLLYFLNRVKLELDMSAPDHRSFMKELEKTAEDPNL